MLDIVPLEIEGVFSKVQMTEGQIKAYKAIKDVVHECAEVSLHMAAKRDGIIL